MFSFNGKLVKELTHFVMDVQKAAFRPSSNCLHFIRPDILADPGGVCLISPCHSPVCRVIYVDVQAD